MDEFRCHKPVFWSLAIVYVYYGPPTSHQNARYRRHQPPSVWALLPMTYSTCGPRTRWKSKIRKDTLLQFQKRSTAILLHHRRPSWSILRFSRYFNPRTGAHPSDLTGEDPAGIPHNLIHAVHHWRSCPWCTVAPQHLTVFGRRPSTIRPPSTAPASATTTGTWVDFGRGSHCRPQFLQERKRAPVPFTFFNDAWSWC